MLFIQFSIAQTFSSLENIKIESAQVLGQDILVSAATTDPSTDCENAYSTFTSCTNSNPVISTDSYSQQISKQCTACSTQYQSMVKTCSSLSYKYKSTVFTNLEKCHQENNVYCRSDAYTSSSSSSLVSFNCNNACHKYYATAFMRIKNQYVKYSYSSSYLWSPQDMADCVGNTCDKDLLTYLPLFGNYFNRTLHPEMNITSNAILSTVLEGLCVPNSGIVNSVLCHCDAASSYGNLTKLYCSKHNSNYCYSQVFSVHPNSSFTLNQYDCNNPCFRSFYNWNWGGYIDDSITTYSSKGWTNSAIDSCPSKNDISVCSIGSKLTAIAQCVLVILTILVN